MLVLDLPMTTTDVASLEVLTLPHDLLELESGLEQGQLVIGHDEDGAYWGLEVDHVRFHLDSTTYRFLVGDPVAPHAVSVLTAGEGTRPLTRGDVAIELRALARARLTTIGA